MSPAPLRPFAIVPIDLLPALSDAELRLYAYLVRHTYAFNGRTDVRMTDEEIMHGRYMKGGVRMDGGSGLDSRGRLIRARKALVERGTIAVLEDFSDLARKETTYTLIDLPSSEGVSTMDTPVSTVDTPVSTMDTQTSTVDTRVAMTDTRVSTVATRTQGRDPGKDLGKEKSGSHPTLPLTGIDPAATKARKAKASGAPTPGMQECIAAFHDRYVARTGHAPTWGDKQCGMLRRLIDMHGSAEVIRRIGVLFTAPPAFLATSPPDLETLVQHFDKLAVPAQPLPTRPTMASGPTTVSVSSTGTKYQLPSVANPVAPDVLRALADDLLAKMRGNGPT
jgi:hypothetical protein